MSTLYSSEFNEPFVYYFTNSLNGWAISDTNTTLTNGDNNYMTAIQTVGNDICCLSDESYTSWNEIHLKWRLTTSSDGGICFNCIDSNNGYLIRLRHDGGCNAYRRISGSWAGVGSSVSVPTTYGEFQECKIVNNGSGTYTWYINETYAGTFTDTTYSTGKLGVRCNNTTQDLDDIIVVGAEILNKPISIKKDKSIYANEINEVGFDVEPSLYLPFNGNAKDYSGNGNDGTVNGATLTTDRFGNTNSAYNFGTRSNAYDITITNNSTIQLVNSTTISMWLYPTNITAGRQNPFNKAYGGEGTITQETSGALNYYWGTNGGNGTPYQGFGSGASVVSNNTWTHICIVRDLTNMVLYWYINGVLTTSVAASYAQATAGSANLLIGRGYAGNYEGSIDDVLFIPYALTPAQVKTLYEDTKIKFMKTGVIHAKEMVEI